MSIQQHNVRESIDKNGVKRRAHTSHHHAGENVDLAGAGGTVSRQKPDGWTGLPQPVVLATVSDLVDRPGWTKTAVARFLGEPDQTKTNPRYAKSAPMRLYDEKRIAAVEATDEWAEWLSKSVKRSAAAETGAMKVAARRADERAEQSAEIMRTVRSHGVQFAVPEEMEIEAARSQAKRHYDGLWMERWTGHGDVKSADDDAPHDFFDRITVNYLRHQLTDYDDVVGLTNNDDAAYWWLRREVNGRIAERFPELADECRRQSEPARDDRELAAHNPGMSILSPAVFDGRA